MPNSMGWFMLLYFSCFCVSWGMFLGTSRTLPHVMSYKAVRPQKLDAFLKRSFPSQKSYPEEVQYSLTIEGQNYTLHLERNRHLIGKNYTLTDYKKEGPEVRTKSSTHHQPHCYYHGHIEDVEDSSVSLSLCSGMRGFVRAEEKVFLIEPLEGTGTEGEGLVAVYRQEHLRQKRSTCSTGNDTFYDHGPSGLFQHSSLKRQRQSGQPGVQRVVEMVLVVDNSEYRKFGSSRLVEARMLEVANHVDKVYRPLGIRVMLVGLEMWSYRDLIIVSGSPDDTLTSFLQWRQDNLLRRTAHDNAQLVTAVDFLGTTVGLATSSAMCTSKSGGVNQDHSAHPVGVASTIAHEMGHNLGMAHDDAFLCSCSTRGSGRSCVMAESIGQLYPSMFSSCSVDQLSRFLEDVNPSCLLDTPQVERIYGGPHCGNAFLESGEECDCGTVEDCSNPCCNASTCTLTTGAQCAQGDCCHNCQLSQVGAVCRPSVGDCDLTEHCSGLSPVCPPDAHTLNGQPCDNSNGYCYNGQCPSHTLHCKRLWGPGAVVAANSCFQQNFRDGRCGRTLYGLQTCSPQDMRCGTLFCLGGREFPVTERKSVITLSQGVICNVATMDPKAQTEDLGKVPTGTKCGNNMVCFDERCQDIKVYGPKDCAAKCNNRGVCNHERQCHCDPGWAPPYCDTELMALAGRNGVVSVSLVVLSLLLTSLLIGSLLYCRKHRQRNSQSKVPIVSTSGQSNPLFQSSSVQGSPRSGPLHISMPTFVTSTATQRCKPLPQAIPPTSSQVFQPLNVSLLLSRSAPQIPKPPMPPPAAPSKATHVMAKPQPPSVPLPNLSKKLAVAEVNCQVLPAKPTLIQSLWKQPHQKSRGPNIVLKPTSRP
ncbi:hypothetical protein DPEC_G00035960 [Dallia pectoralis]|uniref:Uncharacterized protein n=1 Tax=Dallia pectoralis TaxID=75939 RepID=A0ACC2HE46_DALPE|nr:hypothetical protein DPEC_G00035960 [Dallia pectoralis]